MVRGKLASKAAAPRGSLITDARNVYRRMLLTANACEINYDLVRPGGLVEHMRRRFREVSYDNYRKELTAPETKKQLAAAHRYCDALQRAEESPALVSVLNALSMGVGSTGYTHRLEHGYLQQLEFQSERASRRESDDELSSERQNRILLQAVAPYAEKLSALHRGFDEDELRNALASSNASISHYHFAHAADEEVVLEIDESLEKQTAFIRVPEYDQERDGKDLVDMIESPELRGLVCHAGWYHLARRLAESLLEETPLHRSRGTVIVGHGTGGAVAVGVALILVGKGFDIRNTVTFGGSKFLSKSLERWVQQINPLRITMEGDPQVELPITAQDYTPMKHVGEMLQLRMKAADDPVLKAALAFGGQGGHSIPSEQHAEAGGKSGRRMGFTPVPPSQELQSEGTEEGNGAAEEELDLEADAERSTTASPSAAAAAEAPGSGRLSGGDIEPFSIGHYLSVMKSDSVELEYVEGEDEVWEDGYSPGTVPVQ